MQKGRTWRRGSPSPTRDLHRQRRRVAGGHRGQRGLEAKIAPLEAASERAARKRGQGKKIVLTNGCFHSCTTDTCTSWRRPRRLATCSLWPGIRTSRCGP